MNQHQDNKYINVCSWKVKFCNGNCNAAIILSRLFDFYKLDCNKNFILKDDGTVTLKNAIQIIDKLVECSDLEDGLNELFKIGIITLTNNSLDLVFLPEMYHDWLNEILQ